MRVILELLSLLLLTTAELSRDMERELISQFEAQGEISTKDDLIREVGAFSDPTRLKHRNHTELTDFLQDLNRRFPKLTYMYSIGKSVEGRQLWVLVVSKHARQHTIDVPEFKYIANMHGNEVTGRVLLLALAETLLTNYHMNSWMRKLVDTTRIHILPTMNPDGYEIAFEGDAVDVVGRQNANNKDLNRNFPSRFPNFFPSDIIQPETHAVMEWTKKTPFVLSANLHGGTTLVNYPFDDSPTRLRKQKYTPAPDNELFVRLAYSYARAHDRMWKPGPRCVSDDLNVIRDPQYGIVNGADWYIVSGGMQDWNYLNTNCFELTVEMNCVKFPYEKDLRFYWNENKYPMMHYIDQIHNAIHGRIVDGSTGRGIPNATVSIDFVSKIVVSYGDGEFWRLANIGTYEVTFDHPAYTPVTRRVTVTRDRRAPYVAVALERLVPLNQAKPTPTVSAESSTRAPRQKGIREQKKTTTQPTTPIPTKMLVELQDAISASSSFSPGVYCLMSFFVAHFLMNQ